MSALMWNNKFELTDGSNSESDIQDYFELYSQKHGTVADNSSIGIYANKIENRTTPKIMTAFCLELLTPAMIKLLENTKIR